MSESRISTDKFAELVPKLCAQDTAAGSGKGWTPDNPTWGHCTIVAALAQNHFGGELLRASLEKTPFADARSHYWNKLGDGSVVDFTMGQFKGELNPIEELDPVVRTRQYALGASDAGERYAKLAFRFAELVSDDPLLKNDVIYRECIFQALQSPCQKMGKGAVLAHEDGTILASDCNRTIEELKETCSPECIRFKIASRTESMLGSCGHAEERLLWDAVRTLGYHATRLAEMHLYVAGVGANGLPHNERQRPEFTCIRCAVPMAYAGIGSVNVVFQDAWHRQTPQEALETAQAYALGDRKI